MFFPYNGNIYNGNIYNGNFITLNKRFLSEMRLPLRGNSLPQKSLFLSFFCQVNIPSILLRKNTYPFFSGEHSSFFFRKSTPSFFFRKSTYPFLSGEYPFFFIRKAPPSFFVRRVGTQVKRFPPAGKCPHCLLTSKLDRSVKLMF